MDPRKIGKALLFPHIAIMIILLPIASAFLVYSMVFLGTASVPAIASYVLSAYTLTVWCFRVPYLISLFKSFKNENKYIRIWRDDDRLRINISLYGSFIWNMAYAAFQLGLGLYHHSFWFCSLAGYYTCLAVMRFFLVRHTRAYKRGERMRAELVRYRACGIVFLVMNAALSLMVFFMVYFNRTFVHNEITTITMAAYTFTSFAFAIVNAVKYRKFNSPIYSAAKAISLVSAVVSVLTLESTMLNTFNDGTMGALTRKLFLGISGGVIVVFVAVMAIYMIGQSNKKLRLINEAKETLNGK